MRVNLKGREHCINDLRHMESNGPLNHELHKVILDLADELEQLRQDAKVLAPGIQWCSFGCRFQFGPPENLTNTATRIKESKQQREASQ